MVIVIGRHILVEDLVGRFLRLWSTGYHCLQGRLFSLVLKYMRGSRMVGVAW